MSFIPGSNEPLNGTITYKFKIDHRNNSPQKSQWIISCNLEYDLARQSFDNQFNLGNKYYNVLSDNVILQIVGRSIIRNSIREPLKICKFIRNQDDLHGYPANHMMNLQDIPPDKILKDMKRLSLISKRDYKLIRQGKPI